MQQKQLLSVAKTSEDKSLVATITDRRISSFREDSEQDRLNLVKVITSWRLMLGISREPTTEEFLLNANFIISNYGNLSLKDLDVAINLALTGKLGFQVETYGVFSPIVISKVLNAYIAYKNNILNELRREAIRKQEMEENNRKLTKSQKIQAAKEFMVYMIKKCGSGEWVNNTMNTAWKACINAGLVKESDYDDFEAIEYAHRKIASPEHTDTLMDVYGSMVRVNADGETIKTRYIERYAKEYVINNRLKNLYSQSSNEQKKQIWNDIIANLNANLHDDT